MRNQDTLSRLLKTKIGSPIFFNPDAGVQKIGVDSANAAVRASHNEVLIGDVDTSGNFVHKLAKNESNYDSNF